MDLFLADAALARGLAADFNDLGLGVLDLLDPTQQPLAHLPD